MKYCGVNNNGGKDLPNQAHVL